MDEKLTSLFDKNHLLVIDGLYNLTDDQKFLLEPLTQRGVESAIFIDGYINSATTGENHLADIVKVGTTASGVGVLYMHPEGDSDVSVPVLRVRNCDEITVSGAPAVKNGIVETEEGLYYFVNDVKTYAGLIEIDGNFYYVAGGGAVARGNYYVTHANGIMANGHYTFDEVTGKMLLNGICNVYGEDRYYVNGDLAKGAGVVNVAGKLYFVDADGKIVKDATVEVTEAGILGAGTYTADSKGVILLEGLVTLNGVTSYFANNRRAHRAGLVEVDGAYYYVIENGALATGFVTVKSTNGLKPFGVYEFDADGKMIIKNGLVDEEGDTYYYVDGKRTYAGLVEVDGDFYYIAGDCKAVKGRSYFITHTNGLIEKSRHAQFDADGKMIK